MKLLTERLILRPFTLELIDAAIENDNLKIQKFGINSTSEWPEKDLFDALPVFRNLILKHGVDGFNSWIILDKYTYNIIGSLGFIGPPDNDHNVEIGFGIIPSKRNNGYCYEATKCLIDWAFTNNYVNNILAKCDSANTQSKSILQKIGFYIVGVEENQIYWKLHK